jgi:hypothetical protein
MLPERMSYGDGAAMDVHGIQWDVEEPSVGQHHHGECLVDFPLCNLAHAHSCGETLHAVLIFHPFLPSAISLYRGKSLSDATALMSRWGRECREREREKGIKWDRKGRWKSEKRIKKVKRGKIYF